MTHCPDNAESKGGDERNGEEREEERPEETEMRMRDCIFAQAFGAKEHDTTPNGEHYFDSEDHGFLIYFLELNVVNNITDF